MGESNKQNINWKKGGKEEEEEETNNCNGTCDVSLGKGATWMAIVGNNRAVSIM